MATTKKTSTSRKSSKSKNAKAQARPWSWRFSILTIGIYAIAVTTVVLAALFVANVVSAQQNKVRLERIEDIYSSLELPESYAVEHADVFGDKRKYEWDDGRSYSSRIEYVNADTVSATVSDLDKRIKASGFEFVDEPYPGNEINKQYHYKSENGEYIRLTVYSKVYHDALRNALIMNKEFPLSELDSIDKNAGPASAIIKVNLDDNNE